MSQSQSISTIPLSSISVKNRFRKELNPEQLEELKLSIERIGLLTPIIVSPEDHPTHTRYILRAGERRFRAISALFNESLPVTFLSNPVPNNHIPALVIPADTDEITLLEIERDENYCRVNFSPVELSTLVKTIYEYRANKKGKNPLTDKDRYSLEELTEDVYGTSSKKEQRLVKMALKVSDYLEDFKRSNIIPTSYSEALKMITKLKNKRKNRLGISEEDLEIIPEHLHLIRGDFRQQARNLTDVDVVLCNPPYDTNQWLQVITAMWEIIPRICKPDAYVLMFWPFFTLDRLAPISIDPSFKLRDKPLVWYKGYLGLSHPSKPWPRETHEYILIWRRGLKNLSQLFNDLIINYPKEPAKVLGHVNAKPPKLYHYLLNHTTKPNQKVVDLTCNVGTIFYAAERLNLQAYGYESDQDLFKKAYANMKQWHKDFIEGD